MQTPQHDIDTMGGLRNMPLTAAGRRRDAIARRPGDHSRARAATRWSSHYNVRPVIDIYATPQGRDLGGVAADIRQIIEDTAPRSCRAARASSCAARSTTMTSAYQQLFIGLALRRSC